MTLVISSTFLLARPKVPSCVVVSKGLVAAVGVLWEGIDVVYVSVEDVPSSLRGDGRACPWHFGATR